MWLCKHQHQSPTHLCSDSLFKVVLIGDHGVGKGKIILRFTKVRVQDLTASIIDLVANFSSYMYVCKLRLSYSH